LSKNDEHENDGQSKIAEREIGLAEHALADIIYFVSTKSVPLPKHFVITNGNLHRSSLNKISYTLFDTNFQQ